MNFKQNKENIGSGTGGYLASDCLQQANCPGFRVEKWTWWVNQLVKDCFKSEHEGSGGGTKL
jgi:hypothetical protein